MVAKRLASPPSLPLPRTVLLCRLALSSNGKRCPTSKMIQTFLYALISNQLRSFPCVCLLFRVRQQDETKTKLRGMCIMAAEGGSMTQELLTTRYLPEVIIPYFKSVHVTYGACLSTLVWDNNASHVHKNVERMLNSNGIRSAFLPPNTTCVLQPLDVSINKIFKAEMINWSVHCLSVTVPSLTIIDHVMQ